MTKKRTVGPAAGFLFLWLVLGAGPLELASAKCVPKCKEGFKGVCVRIQGTCYCSCFTDVSGAKSYVTTSMDKHGVPKKTQAAVTAALDQAWKRPGGGSRTFKDEEVGTVELTVADGRESEESVVVAGLGSASARYRSIPTR